MKNKMLGTKRREATINLNRYKPGVELLCAVHIVLLCSHYVSGIKLAQRNISPIS